MSGESHGFFDTLLHGGLSLFNLFEQGHALVSKDANKTAALAYTAKTLEEVFTGRIDKKTAVSQVINVLVDYKLTDFLEEKGIPPIFAKSIGLFASHMAGKFVKGIEEKMFPDTAPVDGATDKLLTSGKLDPNKASPSMVEKLENMLGMGKSVDGSGAPGGIGGKSGGFLSLPT